MDVSEDTSTVNPQPVEDTMDLSPIELNVLRQNALADMNHPLHAMFQCELLRGSFEALEEEASNVEGFDLPRIRLLSSQVAGHAQKIMLWVDRMNWIQEHGV